MMKSILILRVPVKKIWISFAMLVVLLPAALAQQKVDLLEYGIDSIPPAGKGTQITIPVPAANDSNFSFNINIGSAGNGLHQLLIRSRSRADTAPLIGHWSQTNIQYFYKISGTSSSPGNIVKLEYFMDTDPGEGNATPVSVTPATQESGISFVPDIGSLGSGIHILFIRSLDQYGKWSLTGTQYFYKQGSGVNPVSKIAKLEYFIDTDPGEGKGTPIPVTPATQVAGTGFNAAIGSLGPGLHDLFIRSLDQNGKWSITNLQYFYKQGNGVATVSNITSMEYFIDTDPGEGNAHPIPLTAASNISGLNFNADISSLSAGFHVLLIRSLDANGKWSITGYQYFFKSFTGTSDTTTIVRIEYFLDHDPGTGRGNSIPLTPAHDIAGLGFNVGRIDTLAAGTHSLFIRSMDSRGYWSLACEDTFQVGSLPVVLLDFTAKADKQNVLLNWQTVSEINSSHFDIERSMDGLTFTKLGSVAALGNSSRLNSYAFEDVNAGTGTWLYRLKMVDKDGRSAYSRIDPVTIGPAVNWNVFPNPASSVLHLVSGLTGRVELKLFSSSGVLLETLQLNGTRSELLDISKLASGVYILQIISPSGNQIQKVVIQH